MSIEALMRTVLSSILKKRLRQWIRVDFYRYRENHLLFDRTWRYEGVVCTLTSIEELHIKI